MNSLHHHRHHRRKKFSSVFARSVSDNEFLRLNQIYSLQLLSVEKKLSSGDNKVIDDIVLNYDFSERTIKAYSKRWFLLAIVILALTISSMQFLQFCIISNVIQDYFAVDSRLIDLTSILYMLIHFISYVPITFYLCENEKLYNVALYGSFGLASTSWLKYFAVVSHEFALILVIQSFCAISHIFLSAIPSKLSAWFPKNEEWLICGLNIFCSNIGIILNFISMMVIKSSKGGTNSSHDLQSFMFIVALLSTLVALLIAIVFKEETPEHPPSYYEALKRDLIIQSETKSFSKALKILATNKNFVLLSIGFGLQLGIFNGFSTLINSIILHYFPSGQMEAGTICFIISALSVFGLFGFAFILERYKSYKTTSMWILRIQSIAFILFSLSLESQSFFVMCFSSALLGILMVGFQLVGQELAVELTFDTVSEDISLGVINIFGFLLGIVVTIVVKNLQESFSILFGNLFFSLLISVGIIFMSLINSYELKRQEVSNFIDSAVENDFSSTRNACEILHENEMGSWEIIDSSSEKGYSKIFQ